MLIRGSDLPLSVSLLLRFINVSVHLLNLSGLVSLPVYFAIIRSKHGVFPVCEMAVNLVTRSVERRECGYTRLKAAGEERGREKQTCGVMAAPCFV